MSLDAILLTPADGKIDALIIDVGGFLAIGEKPLARRHEEPSNPFEAQERQIANSMREFGFTNSILIDENCTIIADHGRKARPYTWASKG